MSKKFLTAVILSSMVCLAGCDSDNNENETVNPGGQTVVNPGDMPIKVEMMEKSLTAADIPAVSDADAKLFGDNINRLASDFISAYENPSSYVFSPFSYHSALSMTAYGANGETYNEMVNVLHLDSDRDKAAKLNGSMRLKLRYDGQDSHSMFKIANRIWVDKTTQVVDSFSNAMESHYKAPLQVVDIAGNPQEIIKTINIWVSNNTGEMIKELLGPDALDSNTRMVLVNAIYLDAKWMIPFKPTNTSKGEFNINTSDKIEVDMMHNTADFAHFAKDGYQAIVMDYNYDAGSETKFAMLVVLPDDMSGLSNVMKSLNNDMVQAILSGAERKSVFVAMPKFKIETNVDNSVDIFKKLGMKKAFENSADFSNMSKSDLLYIGDIVHKAVIEVDEEGTKAAAATAVVMEKNGIAMPETEFKADHPFAFAVVHKQSGTILFAGQYTGK